MEIEEKTETQVAFFRDQYLWKLENLVDGFCARQGIEIVSVQYHRGFFEHICMVVFKQKWLAKSGFSPTSKSGFQPDQKDSNDAAPLGRG